MVALLLHHIGPPFPPWPPDPTAHMLVVLRAALAWLHATGRGFTP